MENFPSQHTKNMFPDIMEEFEMIKAEADAREEEMETLENQLNDATTELLMFQFDLKDFTKLQNKIAKRLEEIHEMQVNRMKMVCLFGDFHNIQESRLKSKKEAVETAANAIESATQQLKDKRKEKKQFLGLAENMKEMKNHLEQQLQFYEKENARMAEEGKNFNQVLEEEETLKQMVQEQREKNEHLTREIDSMKLLHAEIDAAKARKESETKAKILSTHVEVTELQGAISEQHMEQKRIFSKYLDDMEGMKELKRKSEELDNELRERERVYMERKAELMEVNEELNSHLQQEEKEVEDLEERVRQMREQVNEMQTKQKDFDLKKVEENIGILKEKNEQLDKEITELQARKSAMKEDVSITDFEESSNSSKVANWLRTISIPESPELLNPCPIRIRPMNRNVLTSAASAVSSNANGEHFCEVSSTYEPDDFDIFN